MFSVEKIVDSIPPPSTIYGSSSFNERQFQSETVPVNVIPVQNQSIHENPNQDLIFEKFPFKIQCFNQIIKALAILYLALGVMTAIGFFIYQNLNNNDFIRSKYSWDRIGIVNFVCILIVSILTVISKILIYQYPSFIETKSVENKYLFYLIVVISAALSWFSLIFFLLKNLNSSDCAVLADYLLPISRLIFLMTTVMFISDLLNYEIKLTNNNLVLFFFIKLTAILIFVTLVNTIIFEFLHSLSILQRTNRTICNNTNEFIEISNTMEKYFQVFSLVFPIVSVIICIEPLKQFHQDYLQQTIDSENQFLLPKVCHGSQRRFRFISKHFSLTIVISVLIFLLVSFIVPIKVLFKTDLKQANLEIVSNSLPTFAYLICSLADIWLLKLLHENYHFLHERNANSTCIYIIWISLFGVIFCVFRDTMNNLERILNDFKQADYLQINSIGIFLSFENILESTLQTMTLDYLFRINWNCLIKQAQLSRIFNCCVVLIAFNMGAFILDYYNQTGNDIFNPINNYYNVHMWNIMTMFTNPLILIYRIFAPIVLWKFLNKMRCYELEFKQNA